MKYKVRTMTRREVDIAIEWAAREGWNPGLYDADCFYTTDPEGFFMGFLDDEPISCISAVAYNKQFGFLGFYIVKPQFRGKGYGIEIWKTGLAHLKTQTIGLDGVLAQQENYQKSGFKLAYKTIRFQGISNANKTHYSSIVKLSEIPFEQLVEYDNALFLTPRTQFLKCWITQPESLALGAIQNGKVVGHSVIRKCRIGYKIGPLFANNENIAEELFNAVTHYVPVGSSIFLDVPEVNPQAIVLAKRHHMKAVFKTARMYAREQPTLPLNKVFGVTTFELG